MKPRFVQVHNVRRFIGMAAKLEGRAAREACILLATGEAGFGKSGTGLWWAQQHDAVFLRLKGACTPHWVLHDLVVELGEMSPAASCEKLFGQAVGYLARNTRPIVVDEVENGLGNIKVLETIRDISDLVEMPVVFIGREFVWSKLKRYPQFRTRIAGHAPFTALSLADIKLLAAEMLDPLKLTDDLVEAIAAQTEGNMRDIIKALEMVERTHGGREGSRMALADMKGLPLKIEPARRAVNEKVA